MSSAVERSPPWMATTRPARSLTRSQPPGAEAIPIGSARPSATTSSATGGGSSAIGSGVGEPAGVGGVVSVGVGSVGVSGTALAVAEGEADGAGVPHAASSAVTSMSATA